MRYIQKIEYLPDLKLGYLVVFTLDDGTTSKGRITFQDIRNCYYLENLKGYNAEIFDILGIKDRNAFVQEIVGYETSGEWPETRTLEDMVKVFNALLKVNKLDKVEESDEVEPEKKSTPPSEWDWLLG